MKELKNLLKVKTIVTILLTGLFIYAAVSGIVTGEHIVNIFTMVISFYFCTQLNKGEEK